LNNDPSQTNLITRRSVLGAAAIALGTGDAQPQRRLRLWYTSPAQRWIHALPVGDGFLGGMVYGGHPREIISLNEHTLWSGSAQEFDGKAFREALPKVRELLFAARYAEANELASKTLVGPWGPWYGSYQTLGDLKLTFADGAAAEYRRELDLDAGVVRVQYRIAETMFRREVFVSAANHILVVRLESSRPGANSFSLEFARPAGASIRVTNSGSIEIEGKAEPGGVTFAALVRLVLEQGSATTDGGRVVVEGAGAATILVTAATNYFGDDPKHVFAAAAEAAPSYADLRAAHQSEYRKLFGRVTFDLGGWEKESTPTDQRLEAVKAGGTDSQLIALYFQYGRYLLLSSSRKGSLPANLQGIWNHLLDPPWQSDYHININIPMNYWPAEVCNLSETHEPLFDFIDRLREPGRKVAREWYGADGIVLHYTTNAWGYATPGHALIFGLWQDAFPWLCLHLWERYRFTGDKTFLANRAWPVMREACEFYLSFMVRHPLSGRLVPGPQSSPENTYLTIGGSRGWVAMGCTSTIQAVRQLFRDTIAAARIIEAKGAAASFVARLEQTLQDMPPQVIIGKYGQVQEWPSDFDEAEPGHRHVSHLYALHPGDGIDLEATPEWARAARRTLLRRLEHGSGQTGWSAAWMVNFFARLRDGEQAGAALLKLLRQSTEANLFDTHPSGQGPIFQIDGNLGGCAGIAEMLLQSHTRDLFLLPALPLDWRAGKVTGLRARGGLEVDIQWSEGRVKEATIRAQERRPVRVRANTAIRSATAGSGADGAKVVTAVIPAKGTLRILGV